MGGSPTVRIRGARGQAREAILKSSTYDIAPCAVSTLRSVSAIIEIARALCAGPGTNPRLTDGRPCPT